jgi:hypothetical protein
MPDLSRIDKVLDERLLAAWASLADNESRTAWQYGDLLNVTYATVKANALEYTKQDVAVWSCIVTGTDRQPRTLLYYAEVSLFYAPEIREVFEPLPFVHFRYAMTQGENWRAVLDYSLDHLERWGRPPSRKKLRRTFEGIDEDSDNLEKALVELRADQPAYTPVNVLPDYPNIPVNDDTDPSALKEVQQLVSRLLDLLPRLQKRGRQADQLTMLIAQVALQIGKMVEAELRRVGIDLDDAA